MQIFPHYRLNFTCSDLIYYHDWINHQRHAGHSHHHHLILDFYYGIMYFIKLAITHLTSSKLQRISYNSSDNQSFKHQSAYGEWLMISLQHYQLILVLILLTYLNCLSMISLEYAQEELESSYQNCCFNFFM